MKTLLSSVFNSEQSVDMTSKSSGKRPLRTLTAQEKLDAIRRVHDGESKASVARDIGVPESTLRGWCKNETKISFMSQQNDEEGSPDSKSKRIKTDDSIINQLPYNLNMSQVNPVYSPTSSDNNYALDYSNKSDSSRSSTSPLDLQMKSELLKSEDIHHKPSVSQPSSSANEKEKYERSRAELARMGEEFGLNKPENFSFANQFATWNQYLDLQTKIAQQQQQQQQQQQHQRKLPTTVSNTNNTTVCNSYQSSSQSQLASGAKHSNERSSSHQHHSKPSSKDKQFNESLYIYLQAHAAMLALCPPPTTTPPSNGLSSSSGISNSPMPMNSFNNYNNFNGLVDPQTWLLQYFNKSSQHSLDQLRSAAYNNNSSLNSNSLPLSNNLPQQSAQALDNQLHQSQSNCSLQTSSQYSQSNKQILYQELTKETETASTDSENLESPVVDLKEKSSTVTPKSTLRNGVKKGRQVLEMLFNNNNIVSSKSTDSDEQTLDEWEALRHGEMFLKWLEECHPPASVTALQIIQFKNLLNNVRNGAEKKINKTNDHQKTKGNGK